VDKPINIAAWSLNLALTSKPWNRKH
jgi:hypothetical protein